MPSEQQFDIVNKASHYNQHPSEIECIEIAERLSFNAGNAFKYAFRRGDKGNPVLDLNKAIYYLNREKRQLLNLTRWLRASEVDTMFVNPHFTQTDLANIRKLIETEPNKLAGAIYNRILGDCVKISHYISHLGDAVDFVRRLIQETTELQ